MPKRRAWGRLYQTNMEPDQGLFTDYCPFLKGILFRFDVGLGTYPGCLLGAPEVEILKPQLCKAIVALGSGVQKSLQILESRTQGYKPAAPSS